MMLIIMIHVLIRSYNIFYTSYCVHGNDIFQDILNKGALRIFMLPYSHMQNISPCSSILQST